MTTAQELKEQVRAFWDEAPCGTRELAQDDERTRFAEFERMHNEREPFIARFAHFSETCDRDLLEVGVGAGTDHLRFARVGPPLDQRIDLDRDSLITRVRHPVIDSVG